MCVCTCSMLKFSAKINAKYYFFAKRYPTLDQYMGLKNCKQYAIWLFPWQSIHIETVAQRMFYLCFLMTYIKIISFIFLQIFSLTLLNFPVFKTNMKHKFSKTSKQVSILCFCTIWYFTYNTWHNFLYAQSQFCIYLFLRTSICSCYVHIYYSWYKALFMWCS